MTVTRDSTASPQFIHEFQNTFANLEQFFARFRNHGFRQQFFRRDRFESGLGFMEMVEGAFEISYRKCIVGVGVPLGDTVERTSEFDSRGLEFKDESFQVFVFGFVQAQFLCSVPVLHRAFKATMLKWMSQITVLGPNPIDALAMRV